MPWTAAQLREYRQFPQSDMVLEEAIRLAEADCDRVAPELSAPDASDEQIARRDRAIEQLIVIDLQPVTYSGNVDGGVLVKSRNDARGRVLLSLVGASTVIDDGRDRIFPLRYTS